AAATAAAYPGAWVIGADTLVVGPKGEPLGKPPTAASARSMLLQLRGRRHRVVTAQAVIHRDRVASDHLSTLVTMRPYSDEEIAAYLASGDPFDKAGSYAIQHPTFRPVAFLDGCYLNVVGLPICRTARLLREAGFPTALPDLRPPWCQVCRRAAAGELAGL
ncbi:MAG TPA: Maf family protein, partial [Dehalococcoidia bacterium]|nr:Maf family protein [Dehalococcoidia bacterium]